MKLSLKGLVPFACIALLSFLAVHAQETQPQNQGQPAKSTFRTTTRLVVVDVVVTDKDGNPVKDLKAEDFTVTENNEEQKLADFSFHQPGSVAAAGQQLPANIFINAPRYSGNSALNVILLDAINTDFSNHAYAQDM